MSESNASAPPPLLAWERLRAALGAAGLGTRHLDLRTGVLTRDASLSRILGLSPVEPSGQGDDPDLTRIHTDARARVRDTMDAAVEARADYTVEFRIITPEGRLRW